MFRQQYRISAIPLYQVRSSNIKKRFIVPTSVRKIERTEVRTLDRILLGRSSRHDINRDRQPK